MNITLTLCIDFMLKYFVKFVHYTYFVEYTKFAVS